MTPRRRSSTLTEPQTKVLKVIEEYQNTNGFPPSIRDIQDLGNFSSTSVVNYYLEQLESMGHIKRSGKVSRGIRLMRPLSAISQAASNKVNELRESVQQVLRIPVMGRIFASEPVPVPPSDFSYVDGETVVNIARSMLPAKEKVEELFALEVNGDSMIDAMVSDGDIIIMKPAKNVHNGDLVAIWLRDKDETTLKYFFLENGKVRLQPANPTMKPIYIDDPSTVDIQGKIVMIIRPCEVPLV